MADDETTVFAQYAPASFEVDGSPKLAFGVKSVRKQYRADIAKHRRLYKDGARLDHMGSEANVFTLTSEFYNGAEDSAAPSTYPDDANALEKLCESKKTGWLNVPTHGPVRAKCESYDRAEEDVEVDCCVIVSTWVVDSEDDQTNGSFQAPAASSVASRYSIEWVEDGFEGGIDGDPFGEIQDFCDDLAELARAPENYIAAFEARATQTVNAIARVERAYSNAAEDATGEVVALLTQPDACRIVRKGRRLADTIASGANSTTPFATKRYGGFMTIFDVATDVQQDAQRLIAINADLPDLMEIAPRTPVRILAA